MRYSQEQSQIRRCSLVGGNNVVEADAGVAHERGKEGELIAGAGDVREWMQRPQHQQQNTVRERLARLVRIDFELGNPASGNYKQPWWWHVRRRVACMKLEARDARTAETGEKRTCRLPKYRTSTTACRSRHSDLSPTPASRLLGWADTLPAKPGHGIRTWKRSGNPSLESSNFWRSSFNMQGTWRYGSGRKSCAHTRTVVSTPARPFFLSLHPHEREDARCHRCATPSAWPQIGATRHRSCYLLDGIGKRRARSPSK